MEPAKKSSHPSIVVLPYDSMVDEKVNISITGLTSNKAFTLHSFTKVENGNAFECFAIYISDHLGTINLHKDSAKRGMFTGVESMGLFWAVEPSILNKHPHAHLLKRNVTTPLLVTISVYDTEIESLKEIHNFRNNKYLSKYEVASLKVNRWYMAPGTKRKTLSIEKDGIHGTLFIPAGDGPFPGIISLYGFYPGTVECKAALLSSHGYITLALAFYGVPGLTTGLEKPWYLDLEYFEKAVKFLKRHSPLSSSNGIGVISFSLSTTIALRMAEFLDSIRCIVCINGFTCLTFPGIKYGSTALHPIDNTPLLMLDQPSGKVNKSRNVANHLIQNIDLRDMESVINFHTRRDTAFMFIAGLSDEECPSEFHLNHAEKMLRLAKHPNYQLLRYPGTGHAIDPPYGAHIKISTGKNLPIRDWGGLAPIHCKAQEDAWTKQLKFLRSNLCSFSSRL